MKNNFDVFLISFVNFKKQQTEKIQPLLNA